MRHSSSVARCDAGGQCRVCDCDPKLLGITCMPLVLTNRAITETTVAAPSPLERSARQAARKYVERAGFGAWRHRQTIAVAAREADVWHPDVSPRRRVRRRASRSRRGTCRRGDLNDSSRDSGPRVAGVAAEAGAVVLPARLPIPRKTFVVTFDDGYANNLTQACRSSRGSACRPRFSWPRPISTQSARFQATIGRWPASRERRARHGGR